MIDPFTLRMIIVLAVIPTVMAGLTVLGIAFFLKRKIAEHSDKLDALKIGVDGRLTQLIESIRESSFGAGKAAGQKEERDREG